MTRSTFPQAFWVNSGDLCDYDGAAEYEYQVCWVDPTSLRMLRRVPTMFLRLRGRARLVAIAVSIHECILPCV